MKRLLLIFFLCVGGYAALRAQTADNEAARKLQMAQFAIAHLYVDAVDENKLVEDAIIRMLAQLDPHSTYSNAEEVRKMNEPLQGNFEGIGVQFQMIEDTLLVIQPIGNGPSEKAGILAGDRIVAVNDSAIAGVGMSTETIMSRLRGPKDTKVRLGVVRRGIASTLSFTVTRDKIPIHSLDAAYLIQPLTGYIRINRFGATTAEEFVDALKKLRKQGIKDLILDLQGNSGGYLNAAIDLANEFLKQKELIVYTEGRRSNRSNFHARGNGGFTEGRLIVLTDEYSASASEIVAGAVQDWDRGVIVGRRTFGKGLVQRPIELPDGSMMRLTVARYYTPSGRCIQKPYDAANGKNTAEELRNRQERYASDLVERFNRGEMMHADSIHFPDSLKSFTQRLHRTVYGGGGIMPDCFVPMDTLRYTDYHRAVAARGVIIKTTMKYIEQHRQELQTRYRKFEEFDRAFEVNEDMLTLLRSEAEREKIVFDEQQYTHSLPLIKTQLKALIARDLWDMNEYFRVMNTTNESVLKALELLNGGGYEEVLRPAHKAESVAVLSDKEIKK